ncbi:MAG: type VI secretion system Vgr family protein [Pirellulales bacterium]
MPTYTQDGRPLAVETPLGKDKLLLESVSGTEQLSRLFRFDLDVLSPEASIDPKQIVGQQVSFRVNREDGSPRWFTGWVSRFTWVGRDERLTRWRAEVVPSLWFLSRTSDCKIFQNKKVPEIVQEVLKDHAAVGKATEKLRGQYQKWEYCVQYRETDFNFVSRHLEHEGIAYHFEHGNKSLTLVLGDSSSAYTDCADSQPRFRDDFSDHKKPGQLVAWQRDWSFTSGKFAQRDYNFEKPTTDLLASKKGKGAYTGAAVLEIYDYPGEYEVKGDGEADTAIRIEQEESTADVVQGASSCCTFSPGSTFKAPDGKKYLLTTVSHSASIRGAYESDGNSATFDYHNSFSCIPADVPFRPARATPKPMVSGAQTALVVGKSGEEIDTDQYGRIKVQFHWDRYGKKDEKSSCWVRVSQSMAGPGWGGQFIPRIGQEVVITYLEGDPDQPLVTGVVYNGQNKPPFALPDKKTQSGFRSRSTKKAGDSNFNELRFDDKTDAEEIYFHAEKDFKRVVENNDVLEVGASKKKDGNRTVKVFNDQKETIGCSQAKSGSRTVTVWKDDTTTVKMGKQTTTIEKGDQIVRLKMGNRTVKVDLGKESVQAMQAIELKVGGSSIKIDQMGVTNKGMMVKIEGKVMTQVKAGAMATIDGGGMLQAKAGLTMIG